MSIKNSNDTIGNRTRDLLSCSAVSKSTVPLCAPPYIGILKLCLSIYFARRIGQPSAKNTTEVARSAINVEGTFVRTITSVNAKVIRRELCNRHIQYFALTSSAEGRLETCNARPSSELCTKELWQPAQ
jgi:hypothetical protein